MAVVCFQDGAFKLKLVLLAVFKWGMEKLHVVSGVVERGSVVSTLSDVDLVIHLRLFNT